MKNSQDNELPKFPYEEAYGLWFSFSFWIFNIEIWRKGWLEQAELKEKDD